MGANKWLKQGVIIRRVEPWSVGMVNRTYIMVIHLNVGPEIINSLTHGVGWRSGVSSNTKRVHFL
jgi:hypothetical protein